MTDDRSASLTSAATPSTISFLGKDEKKNGHNKSQIKECARDNVFPVAKFLRLEDLPFTDKKIVVPQDDAMVCRSRQLCGGLVALGAKNASC